MVLPYPLDSLVSAECDDGVMCCSAIDDAGKHTRLLVWGLRRQPAPATCPAPCPGERYTAASASTVPRDSTFSQTHHHKEHLFVTITPTIHNMSVRHRTESPLTWSTAQQSETMRYIQSAMGIVNNAALHKHLFY